MRSSFGTTASKWALRMVAMLALGVVGCGADASTDGVDGSEAAESRQRWKALDVQYQAQQTGYWCGPAATRITLSARMAPPTQAQLVPILRTTVDGTNSVYDIVRGLNQYVGANQYVATILDTGRVSPDQKSRFWNDIVTSIDNNYPVVVNIVAYPNNHPNGYPYSTIYHYIVAIGYNPDTSQVYIADSARFSGIEKYWLSLDQLASLAAPKGYAAWPQKGTRCDGGSGMVRGAIEAKYLALGGCNSFLGTPLTDELGTPDEVGRYNAFQNGSIYWTEALGAHEVHGAIRDEWKASGWEAGFLGYPTTDETPTPDGKGRFNKFEKGAIYWMDTTGVHSIHGRIYDKWSELDWEKGDLGYPTSSEYDDNGLRRSDFENGSITWDAKTDVTTVTLKNGNK